MNVREPLLPMDRRRPTRRTRKGLNGIFWILRAGHSGAICLSDRALYDRIQSLAQSRNLRSADACHVKAHDGKGQMSSIVRVHQHASG